MSKKYYVIFFIILFSPSFAKPGTPSDLEKQIIGIWNFKETRDPSGRQLVSYRGAYGTVKPAGPKLIYKNTGKYMKVFTPQNVDSGFWHLNVGNMTIEHQLYIDSTDWVGKDLIKNKLATKSKDGNYYEMIDDQLKRFSVDTLFLNNKGLIDVFVREK